MPIFDLKNAIITFQDGASPTPNSLTAKIGDGTISWTEHQNIEYKRDRGLLDQVRLGDQDPVDVKFEFNWVFLKGTGGPSPGGDTSMEDALKKRGGAAQWVSADTDPCAPYAINIQIVYTPICTADDIETIVLPDFRWETLDHDAKAATISCSGKCNVTQATLTRTTN
ncbi:MAG: hypothetical protein KGI50_06470 [Patescibacteria group bacterium]|nr:hypothetical protein [Patescibacteria group bacterium]MDE2439181.1 hypothetical protein [Patescibacteria group bacterium]